MNDFQMHRPVLLGALALLIAVPLQAARIRRLTPAELSAQASEVLVVDVLDASQRAGEAGMTWTDYRVRVTGGARELTLPFANDILGVPRLEIGGRYRIHLDDAPRRPVPVVGWSQGIVRLDGGEDGHSGSCKCGGFASFPIAFEIDHDPDYTAAARAELERWNEYADVFEARPGDGVAGPNGVNEIAFLDRATASAKYGINMDRNTFAITYVTPLAAAGDFDGCPIPPQTVCGTFDEADVIVNAEFVRGFTAFGPLDYADRGPALYGATVAHELGHALGFHHNVGNISVMNLYEDFAARYIARSDAVEARNAFPSRARPVTDLATYPFSFDPSLTDYAATKPVQVSPAHVEPGGAIVVRNFGFENVGTDMPPDVELQIVLSRDAVLTDEDTEIAAIAMSGAFHDDGGQGQSIVLPLGLPEGTYYLGAVITYAGGTTDEVAYNNSWIAPQRVTIGSAMRRRAVRR